MNKTLLTSALAAILLFAACQQPAPKPASEAPAAAAEPASKEQFISSGPDVDLLKKTFEAYEKGDWTTLRSCFSDSAVSVHNQWIDSTGTPVPVDAVIARHKEDREKRIEGMSIGTPIYEAVVTADGTHYGHVWAKLSTKNRKTQKPLDFVVFASYGIKDGKLTYEWAVYDTKNLVQ